MKAFKVIQLIVLIFFFTIKLIIAQETKEDYYNKGVEYAGRGDFDSAKVEFIQALNIDSSYYPAEYSLERINDALNHSITNETAIHVFRGVSLTHKNMNIEAIDEYNQAIDINPEYMWSYYSRGYLYFNLGKYQQAINDFNKAIEINPNFAEAYNSKGNAFFYSGKYLRALDDYNKAVELDPFNDEYYHNRGLANFYLKKDEEAIEDYTKALTLNPTDAIAYDDRGVAYLYDEVYGKAMSDFNKCIDLKPDYALAYYNRGRVYNNTKYFEKAMTEFNRSIELDPKLSFAYNDRGILYIVEFDDPEKGCADLKMACILGFCEYYNAYAGNGVCP